MDLLDFTPQNELEHVVVEARINPDRMDYLVDFLEVSDLFIPSKSEVQQDGSGFDPLLMEKDGMALVSCFTSIDRPIQYQDEARFLLQMNGREFFLRLPHGFGAVFNPGYYAQFLISPDRVDEIKRTN